MNSNKDNIVITEEAEPLFIYSHSKEIIKALKLFMSNKYYDGTELIKKNSHYLMAFGEKSNGKSTFFQMVACIIWWLWQRQSVLLRLYNEDFLKGRAEKMFGGLPKGFISKITKGQYDSVVYKHFAWYFARFDDETGKYIFQAEPFCFRQCILNSGSSFQMPEVDFIFFDEFIRKDTQRNVPDEFVEFQTVISTIKRSKTSLQIAMAGNTVNYYSVYFKEMGLTNIRKQLQGTIDVYNYGNTSLSVAVEYCDTPVGKNQESNVYFAFNNPKLQMITSGKWQLEIYPHLKAHYHYKPKEILLTYFIKFDDTMFQCDIVNAKEGDLFTYIHDEIGHTVDFNNDIVYQQCVDPRPNIATNILKAQYDWQHTIASFFASNKVFYKSNDIGDMIHAYLRQCR